MRTSFALSFLLASSAAFAQEEAPESAAPADEAPATVAGNAEEPETATPEPETPAADTPSEDAAVEASEPPSPGVSAGEDGAAPPAEVADAAPGESLCPSSVPCMEAADFAFWPAVRLRVGYELVQPDEDVLFVGHNDGFFFDQARLGFETTYKGRFFARLVLEMASVLPGVAQNDPVRPLVGAARDAYLAWAPSEYFFLSVGQQFMPFDYEGQLTRGALNFTSRSIATDGLRAGRGFELAGLSTDRQLGVVLGARKAPLGPVNLDYRLAIANGNDKNLLGNDNKLPAAYARLGASFGDYVGIGVAGELNPRTTGALPTRFNETHIGVAGDLRLNAFGIDVLAQAIYRRVSFDDVFLDASDPNAADQAFGATAWIVLDEPFGLPMFGFKPGYRFSYYDPSFSDPHDQLMEHTVSIRYDPPTPLRLAFILEGTLLSEHAELDSGFAESPRALDNNRIVALVQFEL